MNSAIAWIPYDLVIRAIRTGWSATMAPWGASLYVGGTPVHLRVTIDGIWMTTADPYPIGPQWTVIDSEDIDQVAERVLSAAA